MPELDWLVSAGAGCLGFVLGALIGLFVADSDRTTATVFTSAVGVIVGAGIIGLFKFLFGGSPITREIWFYPVGLAIGFLCGLLISHVWHRWLLSRGIADWQVKEKLAAIRHTENQTVD